MLREQLARTARFSAGAQRGGLPRLAADSAALAGVLQLMLEELGAAQLAGEDTATTAARLGPQLDRQLAALEPLG